MTLSKNSLRSYRGCARGGYTKGNNAQTMLCEKKKQWGLLWERNQLLQGIKDKREVR